MKTLLPITFSILVLTSPIVSAGDWQSLGPAPLTNGNTGRVSAIACSPSNPSLYYAGGADGGVWKTEDGGLSWTPLTDHLPTTSIGAIELAPSDENIIYVGTGEANYANHSRYGLGLYKSIDGGQTWSHLAEDTFGGRCFSRIVVHPTDPDIVYAAITRAGGFPELAAAKGHPGAEGDLGVFKSLDGGQSWTRLTQGLPNLSATDLIMDPTAPNTLYCGIGRIFGSSSNGVYKTQNGGGGWTKLGGGFPTSSVGRIALALAPSLPSRIYALVASSASSSGGGADTRGAYRSDNGGGSWSSLGIGNIQASYGWYLCVVSVKPDDPQTVFMGGLTLERSTNGGNSWSGRTPPHVDLHALEWDASGRLLAGDDGGVHRTSNLGTSWSSRNDGLGIIQFYAGLSLHPSDDRVVFGGTQDNGTNRRNTDTVEWRPVLGGDGGWTQLDRASPSRVYAEYQGTANLYRSTDSGGDFDWVGSGINFGDRNAFLPPYVIDPNDSTRMFYGTHRVYRSTNRGNSWNAISGDLTGGSGAIRALAIAPSDSQVLYAATNDGRIAVSTNGGSTFQTVRTGQDGWPRVTREIQVHPFESQTAYLATSFFGRDQVLRTRDTGQTWEVLDGDLPDIPVNTVTVDPRTNPPVLFAGTDSGVYHSLDDGAHWRPLGTSLPPVPVIDLIVETERNRLVAGTQGRGAWTHPLTPARRPRPDVVK